MKLISSQPVRKAVFLYPFLILFAGSSFLLASAWFKQLVLGWTPCGLCLWQREPHYAVLVIGLALLLVSRFFSRAHYFYLAAFGFSVLSFFVALYRSGFHVGVEQLWWDGWETCSGSKGKLSVSELLSAPSRDCSLPVYIFPHISMALGHFLVLSLILVVVCTFFFRLKRNASRL